MQNPPTWETRQTSRDLVLTGLRGYLLAAVCVTLAWWLRWLMNPFWTTHLPYGLFFLSVIIVAHFAGVRQTVFACVTGFLLGTWFFAGPHTGFLLADPVNRFNGAAYFGVSALVTWLSVRTRRAIRRERATAMERERLVGELQKALNEVKTLSGLLPICSYCKKIRDDSGSWNKIEQYLHKHAGADFTHSVCPECVESHFAKFSSGQRS